MTITVQRTISMGHRLPSYEGICSSPHGHNVRIECEINTTHFLDFKEVDALLKHITDPMDHAMVLQASDTLLPVLREMNFRTVELPAEPTTENIARAIHTAMRHVYNVVRTTVHETDKYSATVLSPE